MPVAFSCNISGERNSRPKQFNRILLTVTNMCLSTETDILAFVVFRLRTESNNIKGSLSAAGTLCVTKIFVSCH
jgi:hypothetical protein